MPRYQTSITVPHTPDNMFALVSDIARYPDFIRWIRTMSVSQQRIEGDVQHCLGEASVGFRGFSERFATTVEADPKAQSVRAVLVRGPFKRLKNVWAFSEISGGTKIDFDIDYEFSNFILRMLAKNNFRLAVDKIMGAFLAEADRRYERVA
ncbi:MAG: type II toxin-antitoxin system RatA family toxin [Pseudomonadota bacterium]